MKVFYTIILIALGMGCTSKNEVIVIDKSTFQSYKEFREGINKMICDSLKFKFNLEIKDNLNPIHFCETDKIIVREINYFSISDTPYSRFQIHFEDSLLMKQLENFIINPKKRVDNAMTPKNAFVILLLSDNYSSLKLFQELNRISRIFEMIRIKHSLTNSLNIRFERSPEKSISNFIKDGL